MTLGTFMKCLAILGYPVNGKAISGGGIGLKSGGVLSQPLTAPFTLTGSTAEAPAFVPSIPANTLVLGMRIRVWVPAGRVTGNAGFWLVNFYVNNTKVGASNHSTAVASESIVWEFFVQSATTLVGMPGQDGIANNSAIPVVIAFDPTQPLPLKITMTNSVAADSTVVFGYSVEVLSQ